VFLHVHFWPKEAGESDPLLPMKNVCSGECRRATTTPMGTTSNGRKVS